MTALEIARMIVSAENRDDWMLADSMRPLLHAANRTRRAAGLKPVRATQDLLTEATQ